MRYKNTPYLNDYEAETRRWHIKRTEQLNEDYERFNGYHQDICNLEAKVEALENGEPDWTAISNITERLDKLEHIHKLEHIADEHPPVSFDRTPLEGYWWCNMCVKRVPDKYIDRDGSFHYCFECGQELEHRIDTDEKGGTRPPDEHHELQDFADKRTAPGEQKAEKVYIDDLLSLPPDEQKDELRCIDCGEKARAVNTRNGFCYVCEHNNHTTTAKSITCINCPCFFPAVDAS